MVDYYNIPIFVISYNRVTYLKKLVERLHSDGYKNIIIVDNNSNNRELLEYLNQEANLFKVVFLDKNYGHKVIWECGLFSDVINNQYYVVTDPDILPVENCPPDYIEKFYNLLTKYPQYTKVGFSLMLSDLPADYKYRTDIWRWESFFWEHPIEQSSAYIAEIDTTFALYQPINGLEEDWYEKKFFSGIRTEKPYIARHLAWYTDSSDKTEEDEKYFNNNKIQTTLNKDAMNDFNTGTIRRLYLRSNDDLYEILKRICCNNEKPISFKNVLKSCWLLLRIKIFNK